MAGNKGLPGAVEGDGKKACRTGKLLETMDGRVGPWARALVSSPGVMPAESSIRKSSSESPGNRGENCFVFVEVNMKQESEEDGINIVTTKKRKSTGRMRDVAQSYFKKLKIKK
ncbi:hypothetical protein GE061_018926 [Apolygus lucorum]|uniref:Uncharacterized protein n=1 Tax=Apolygus lucorum TaxID=248454 RepID=A0A8S9X8F0_APOLU|nr:hypothetical protein GE061_018926 [Apolygus lucorum]